MRGSLQSEQGRSLALAAGQMGSWDWDLVTGEWNWDEGQHRIFGVAPRPRQSRSATCAPSIHPEDWDRLQQIGRGISRRRAHPADRVSRAAARRRHALVHRHGGREPRRRRSGGARSCGVTIDITERKEAEERQVLLAREVDHRARNALAVVQSIVRLTRAKSVDDYVAAVEGRIKALARAHALLSESRWQGADLARAGGGGTGALPRRRSRQGRDRGPNVSLLPHLAQGLALALHELATNAAKYGALSSAAGKVELRWQWQRRPLTLRWVESGGPRIAPPS